MLNMLCPKVHFNFVQNRCYLCPKSGLNLANMWLFASPIQDTKQKCSCWLKIVNHCDKRGNSVMQAGKDIKSGFKKVRMKTDVATHTCKLLLIKNDEHLYINILLL